ncbi:MAG: hypothetical protein CMP23_00030 [Rickettsiales bacterium]|nr:hypothetical protein [Rickettsiales bacterium]|tara:strand:- start:4175 stop:5740 length:1566 start_codon:yes stop_codon:yes gene_type:complete
MDSIISEAEVPAWPRRPLAKEDGDTRSPDPNHARRWWLLILLAMALSLGMRPIPWADSTGAVYGPISFLCEGNWDLDEFPFLYEREPHGGLIPSSSSPARPSPGGDRVLAFTGLGAPLLALPGAIPPLLVSSARSEIGVLRSHQLVVLLCTIALLWLSLRALESWMERAPPAWVLPALFFGTVLWPQTRQTLWSNQSTMLGLGIVLWISASHRTAGRSPGFTTGAALGLAMGHALLSRPSSLLISLPLLVALGWIHRHTQLRWLWSTAATAAPLVALWLYDNQIHSGSPWVPPFAVVGADIARVHGLGEGALSGPPLPGLAGLLLSPSRGLLIFSPWLLALSPQLLRSIRSPDPIRAALITGITTTLLINANYTDWWGGDCWGPRRLQELLPGLLMLSLPKGDEQDPYHAPQGGRLLAVLLTISVLIQGLGFFVYDSSWDLERGAVVSPEGEIHATADTSPMWAIGEGVLSHSLNKLLDGELQFGWENQISLAAGWRYQPQLPPCTILKQVDRYPSAEPAR